VHDKYRLMLFIPQKCGIGLRAISKIYFLTYASEKEDRGLEIMTILYALVARGTVVLAEFSAASGNASTIARRILEKIPAGGDSRVSYSQDRHIFHIMKADGLTFLCMATDTFGSKMVLSYAFSPQFMQLLGFRILVSILDALLGIVEFMGELDFMSLNLEMGSDGC
jgi:hypothetical protein